MAVFTDGRRGCSQTAGNTLHAVDVICCTTLLVLRGSQVRAASQTHAENPQRSRYVVSLKRASGCVILPCGAV